MLEIIAVGVAACSLIAWLFLAHRVNELELRLANGERRSEPLPFAAAPSLDSPVHPIAGRRVCIDIEQDHELPVFSGLLKSELEKQDVVIVGRDEFPEIGIFGKVICNGYSEIFYTAELRCISDGDTICSMIEKPPHGDRQINLAVEFISRLTKRLVNVNKHQERSEAIRELGF